MDGGIEQLDPSRAAAATRWGLGLAGGIVGGVAGYFLVGWLARQGFYAVALPGVLLGIGGGWLGPGRSKVFSIVCGGVGLALGLLTEWGHFFSSNHSLGFFLAHVFDLPPISLIMIAVGALAAFWFTWRTRVRAADRVQPPPP